MLTMKHIKRAMKFENLDGRGTPPVDSLVSLRWSSEEPTETGWYWLRSAPSDDSDPNDNEDAEIVLVRGDTETCPKRVLSIDGNRSLLTSYTDRPGYVQWAGPLPFPISN